MPNFGAVISNLAAPLAQTVASHNFAQIAENDKQRQIALQEIALSRQAQQDANLKALQDSTINRNNATATKALMPPVQRIDPYSQQGVDAAVDKATRLQAIQPPKLNPHPFMLNGKATLGFADERGGLYGSDAKPLPPGSKVAPFTPPLAPPVQSIQVLPGADGKPAQGVVTSTRDPSQLGKTIAIPDVNKAGGGAAAGTPQQKASLEAGLRTLDAADKDATAVEEKYLAKIRGGQSAGPSMLAGTLGSFADPSKHPDAAPAAGGVLNALDPDFAKYNKSLTAAANAGMLISTRPSDMRAKKEQFLAGISTNPTEDQIMQARQWRADMKAGFEAAIRNGASQPSGGKTLSAEDAAHAQRDPAFAKWLRGKGYEVP